MNPRPCLLAVLGSSLLCVVFAVAAPAPQEVPLPPLGFRTDAETRAKLVKEHGGTEASEAAVASGLAWIATQQAEDGSWTPDRPAREPIAGTGLALLTFLGTGESHKSKQYGKRVRAGLDYLIERQSKDGGIEGTPTMYSHGIATIALCEAYALTTDERLRVPAQRAVDFLVKAQSENGSWGYAAGTRGDTSITGWQVQALAAAKLARLEVPAETFDRANAFLDTVMDDKGGYGYQNKNATPSLTAVGGLCRSRLGVTAKDANLRKTVDFLNERAVPGESKAGMYCWYYATPLMLAVGGDDWKAWNPKMRDWLIDCQQKGEDADRGSWAANGPIAFTSPSQFLNTTSAVLTLEVYYRYPPSLMVKAVGK